jgi:hypothetical protein
MTDSVCFPEPGVIDNRLATRGESVPQFLQRSTHPRALEVRRFLNHNIAWLPEDARASFCHDLKKKWASTLFELVVARTLQILGGSLAFEQPNIEGRRPDFRARFGKHAVVVEATAPQFDQETVQEEKKHTQLLNIIESRVPGEWSVLLQSLPNYKPSESKASLKKALEEISNQPPPQDSRDLRPVRVLLSQGSLEFTLVPGRYGGSAIVGGPVYVSWSDAKRRILHALNKKRSQVRAEEEPVLLAILASGITAGFDDFDDVLFGHHVTELDPDLRPCVTRFDTSGAFAKGTGLPTYSGVLAFTDLTPFGCKGPVLYVHPRSIAPFPEQFEVLGRRILGDQGIEILPATDPDLLEELNWVRL